MNEGAAPGGDGGAETYASRRTSLGSLPIWRALPLRGRRMVGPWCFLDRYGPLTFSEERPMEVAPHPHIGLQTVSWLLAGEVLHHDSLGLEGLVRPGGVNVMTAGRGIAHSEETPMRNSGRLDGVQLWIALPDADRHVAPAFESIAEVPQLELRGGTVALFAGELEGIASPATAFSDLVGAEVAIPRGATLQLPLTRAREHALFLLDGEAEIAGVRLEVNTLHYLPPDRDGIPLRSSTGGRILLIGGLPFGEPVLMWWNFVARSREEIAAAREGWARREMFGEVPAWNGPRIEAPELSTIAPPNPAS
jgi:quercetin 2,3-dioxygenase